jgi:molybdopterin molybdotransferase
MLMATDKPMKRPPLMSLDEALDFVLKDIAVALPVESVPTFEADGRVLAESLVSQLQVPPQDNASMDGYALRVQDLTMPGARLKVTQRIPAGHTGQELKAGEAARIFTGAPIPAGANAVVMQEDTQLDSATAVPEVSVNVTPSMGQWIRRSGEDVTLGAEVLAKGTRLDPAALGLAASIGVAQVRVVRRPRVALFSTGDELRSIGTELAEG